jgi:hypothetical protein
VFAFAEYVTSAVEVLKNVKTTIGPELSESYQIGSDEW